MALDDFEDAADDPLEGLDGLLDADLDPDAEASATAAEHDDPLGFDELEDADGLDASAESDLLALAADLPEFDEDDDLFDFDEIVRASLEDSGFHAGIDDLLDEEDALAEDAPTQASEVAEPVASSGGEVATEDLLAAPATGSSGRYVWQEGRGAARVSPTAVLLALVAICNLALVGVAWRSLGTVETAVSEVGMRLGEQVLAQASAQRAAPIESAAGPAADTWRPIEVDEKPEGFQALELARDDIAQGAFARARRRLYSLLCVLDRVEPSRRTDVEARARLLVADCWRAEAERLGENAR